MRTLLRDTWTVSLPRDGSKKLMTVHSTHCLFLTCTQESPLYLHNVKLIDSHTMHRQLVIKSLEKIKNPNLLGRASFLLMVAKFPSPLVPCLVSTAPSFDSYPFHPFPTPSAHITLFTTTTSMMMVFFVHDMDY
jgi:hypothetical protein